MDELTPSQFLMLKTIAKTPSSASEIAVATNISLPYVLNQLALLEARNYVQKEILREQTGPGKPKKQYSLSHEIASISILREGFGNHIIIPEPSKMLGVYLQMLTLVPDKNKAAFSEYFWKHIDYLEAIRGIAFISEQNNTVELLALTHTKHLDELRKNISSYIIKQKEYKGMRISCWVHSEEEILHGIKNHDGYYINLMQKAKILSDPHKELQQVLEQCRR